MKFNLFLLTIVLLGSIPCFYAANLAKIHPQDPCRIQNSKRRLTASRLMAIPEGKDNTKGTCKRGKQYLEHKLSCKKGGINKIRSLANKVYTDYRDTIINSDVGDFFQVGTIDGCNGMSADSCKCSWSWQITETLPPNNLKDITTIKTPHPHRTKGSFVILVEKLEEGNNKKCKFAIAHEVNSIYYIMPMTCPPQPSYIVTAMMNGAVKISGKGMGLKRRRLLQKGDCDT
jgi:hypothetical protein